MDYVGQHHEFGTGFLVGRTTGAVPGSTIFGTVQEVSLDLSGDLARLTGQYEGIVDAARKGMKVAGKMKFAKFNGKIFNDLYWNSVAGITTGQMITNPFTAQVIPATPYTVLIVPPAAGVFAADCGVQFVSNGNPLKRVAATPVAGEYTCNEGTGSYLFAAADTLLAVYISYDYTITGGFQVELDNKIAGNAPTFEMRLDQARNGYGFHVWLYSCVASKMTLPWTNEDFSKRDFEFEAIPNAANKYGKFFWDANSQ